MGRKADKEEKAPQAADAESEEKKRLRTLAVSKKLLRRSPANSSASLDPSNAIIKLQGRDIVKRGQRKSRYLFSFPGLICPLSAGKIGVLANLATRNPLLYLEFPLGRMKLFGTHVFPKNKYLALQLTKSAKGVMCEDVFESLIVFSEARWIGQEDENPEEYQLEFPKDLVEGKDSDYDFKGGAGATTHEEASGVQKTGKGNLEPHSPDNELESDDYDDFSTVIGKDEKKTIETTPLRQSARTSRKVSYAESASEKDSTDSDTEAIDGNELKINAEPDAKTESPVLINRDYSGVVGPTVSSPETEVIATKEVLSEEAKQSPQKSIRKSPNKKGTLVQARLSSLFEKVTDKDDHHVTSILENHERLCWGCGLRLLLATYSPVFKCGWCGAITTQTVSRKPDSACFSRWRRIRDHFFVVFLLPFMFFVICAGVWAVYPTIFSISYFCGVFHSTITAILSFITISSFCLAAFKSAGAPVTVTWGSYPVVGKNGLENYTFCAYCEKPKPPRAHHCRSCRMCVLDMDHHCPFIGNCVGAANHRHFIIFLISIAISCLYVVMMTSYVIFHILPSQSGNMASTDSSAISEVLKQVLAGIVSSILLLSVRGLVLLYLSFACLSIEIGIIVLLWQQLYYIYEGKTYIAHISSQNSGNGGCQNILRFFSCPYWAYRFFLIPANAAKLQESSSKVL